MSISRPDERGFQVRVQRNGTKHSRYFSIRKYGGERQAYRAAKAYEKTVIGTRWYRHRPRRQAQSNNKSTGILGVHFGSRLRKGVRVYEYKVSYWDPKAKKRRVKSFHIGNENTYDKDKDAQVRERAIAFRRATEQQVRSFLINETKAGRSAIKPS